MNRLEEVLGNRNENFIFPFFWQHGETEEKLREYMKAINDCGIGAVCLECRPHPDFLGPKWWQDFDVILDEAKKRNMKIWILDDAHFPTGFTNGALKDEPDEKWKQFLNINTVTLEGPMKDVSVDIKSMAKYKPPIIPSLPSLMGVQPVKRDFNDEELISVVLVTALKDGVDSETVTDCTKEVKDGVLNLSVPEGTSRLNVIYKTRNGGGNSGYINLISGHSVKVLLDTVYEPHYEKYKEYFGNIIEGFFSDEPQLGNINGFDNDNRLGKDMQLPWSEELEENLKERYKDNYGKYLPLLWMPDRKENLSNRVRYIYMDEMTKLVQKDFSMQIGNWCQEHGVRYIGHIIEDDGLHARLGSSVGHYFRGLAGQHMAGIDDIGGQVIPGGEDANRKPSFGISASGYKISSDFYHFALGKLGASHAALDPRKNGDSMCEIFGAYGWSEGTREMKYLTDHFLVRGINHFVPHAFSPKEFPDPDCPPHFYAHGLNPLYQGFGELMKYMNRVCHLFNKGKAVTPAMVLYHAENEWISYEESMMFSRVPARILSENQLDFLFVWLDALTDKDHYYQTKIENGILSVNGRESRVLVIPESHYILKELAEFIVNAAEKGLKILFLKEKPVRILDPDNPGTEEDEAMRTLLEKVCESTEKVSEEDLPKALEEIRDIRVFPAFKDLRTYHFVPDENPGLSFVMVSNESVGKTFDGYVKVNADGTPFIYDAMDNRLFNAQNEDGKIRLKLSPCESCILIFTEDNLGSETKDLSDSVQLNYRSASLISGPFRVSFKEALNQEAGYKDSVVLKELISVSLIKPEFSGWISYETSFVSNGKACILSLENAYESVEAFVNGKSAGTRICPPYNFNLSGLLKEGENELKLICSTTLENAVNTMIRKLPDTPENFLSKMFLGPVTTPFGIIGKVSLLTE